MGRVSGLDMMEERNWTRREMEYLQGGVNSRKTIQKHGKTLETHSNTLRLMTSTMDHTLNR